MHKRAQLMIKIHSVNVNEMTSFKAVFKSISTTYNCKTCLKYATHQHYKADVGIYYCLPSCI